MKLILALGNPGSDYDDTRHNVGWWVADRLAHDWNLGGFSREGAAFVTQGVVGDAFVVLAKPNTYVNRSGAALPGLLHRFEVDPSTDLLVIVDDATLDVGRVRLRGSGGAGGHNGLKSVAGVLGTKAYARLRIGVGPAPPGGDLADWVLAPMGSEDEDVIVDLLPELTPGVEVWIEEGVEAAMNRLNR